MTVERKKFLQGFAVGFLTNEVFDSVIRIAKKHIEKVEKLREEAETLPEALDEAGIDPEQAKEDVIEDPKP